KPEKPNHYDGSADYNKFTCFCTEVRDYTDYYQIPSRRLASTISRFLEGRAWDYYAHEILLGIFNYCFPLNFREKLRTKTRNFRQGSRDVREYIYKLETLLDLAGINEEKDRIQQLWNGFRIDIRVELTARRITTTTHTWEQI
ncbi:hypothetical protein K474DRAFT_1564780, partial [Panus rudis PR-1116 ss-1]